MEVGWEGGREVSMGVGREDGSDASDVTHLELIRVVIWGCIQRGEIDRLVKLHTKQENHTVKEPLRVSSI